VVSGSAELTVEALSNQQKNGRETRPPASADPGTPGQLQVPHPVGAQPQPAPIDPEKPAAVCVLKAENSFTTSEL
jgi:hypothetical protein